MPITVRNTRQQLNDSASIVSLLGDFAFFDATRAWVFPGVEPRAGADGCVGSLCVSRALELSHPGLLEPLALHLSFNMTRLLVPSLQALQRLSPEPLKVTLEAVRFTARPSSSPALVSLCPGGPIILPEISLQLDQTRDWNFGRAGGLLTRMGFEPSTQSNGLAYLQAVLTPFSKRYLDTVADKLAVALANRIKKRLRFQDVSGSSQGCSGLVIQVHS
ncbi:hypothetical protein POL68_17015 [Stigmatella sp. ncwal1]|uniref:Uncharacterized protein n=1 Tax=Stigmatella ashevillensis TaxID=2995309 RepID=A0ABT5D9D5_9BACT|nr:hypothetical protein [Stigmatella ashevillena]MDC0710181.1 hypothetical protein [Stigmatella ashevillena]